MKDRILAAWSVLRGTHKAVPMAASVFYGNWYTTTTATTAPIYFNTTNG